MHKLTWNFKYTYYKDNNNDRNKDRHFYNYSQLVNIYKRKGIPESRKMIKEEMTWQTGFGKGVLKRESGLKIWCSGK